MEHRLRHRPREQRRVPVDRDRLPHPVGEGVGVPLGDDAALVDHHDGVGGLIPIDVGEHPIHQVVDGDSGRRRPRAHASVGQASPAGWAGSATNGASRSIMASPGTRLTLACGSHRPVRRLHILLSTRPEETNDGTRRHHHQRPGPRPSARRRPVFRSIPYAAPPVGPLRFRPPVAAAPWNEVFEATTFGPVAAQLPSPLETDARRSATGVRRSRRASRSASSRPQPTRRSGRSCSGSTVAPSSTAPARHRSMTDADSRSTATSWWSPSTIASARSVPAPRRHLRPRVHRIGQRRDPRPGPRTRMGPEQHRRVRWRPGAGHHLRPVRRRYERWGAPRPPRRAGPVLPSDRAVGRQLLLPDPPTAPPRPPERCSRRRASKPWPTSSPCRWTRSSTASAVFAAGAPQRPALPSRRRRLGVAHPSDRRGSDGLGRVPTLIGTTKDEMTMFTALDLGTGRSTTP